MSCQPWAILEDDWELLDGEDLLDGVGDLVEGEVEQRRRGACAGSLRQPSTQGTSLMVVLARCQW